MSKQSIIDQLKKCHFSLDVIFLYSESNQHTSAMLQSIETSVELSKLSTMLLTDSSLNQINENPVQT
jgi:hypothetical protein